MKSQVLIGAACLLAAISSSAAVPPTEAECLVFIREYYVPLHARKPQAPTNAAIKKWQVCTGTYSRVMDASDEIIRRRRAQL